MLPVKHPAQKIIVVVNYCERQLARRSRWTAPACHKNEDATLHPGACKYGLQYDGRPGGRLGVWIGMWN